MVLTLNNFLEKELYNSAFCCYSSDCLTLQRPPAVRARSKVIGSCLLSDDQLRRVRSDGNGAGGEVEVVEIHAATDVLTILVISDGVTIVGLGESVSALTTTKKRTEVIQEKGRYIPRLLRLLQEPRRHCHH
jgi:hypothetical protein